MSKGKPILEKRFSTEFRFELERREVSGLAVPWSPRTGIGDYGRETVERGAFGDPSTFRQFNLTRMHERVVPIAANPVFTDTEKGLEIRATIAETSAGDEVLREIEAGLISGFSIEMFVQRESRRGGLRYISKSLLSGVSLVDFSAYKDATIQEVRQREIEFQRRNRQRRLLMSL